MHYLLFIIKKACDEFEERAGKTGTPRGAKTALVESAITRQQGSFRVSDIRDACPDVGIDLIRRVLSRLKGKEIECLGRGQTAQWRRIK
jgi:hypothetical protein